MKSLFLGLMIALMLCALAACGDTNTGDSNTYVAYEAIYNCVGVSQQVQQSVTSCAIRFDYDSCLDGAVVTYCTPMEVKEEEIQ
ncbi:MAG: hypothetical protein KAS32_30100 [Candidatus Peribacteraceae bacterium]|nr:hypothetical protein [Candidatus Peribacteraceae bacterium]